MCVVLRGGISRSRIAIGVDESGFGITVLGGLSEFARDDEERRGEHEGFSPVRYEPRAFVTPSIGGSEGLLRDLGVLVVRECG